MKETDASCSNLIDGKAIAEAVNRETASEVANIAKQYGAVPGLAVVLVGDNPASQVYVNTKVKKCAELGIYSEKIVLPKETKSSAGSTTTRPSTESLCSLRLRRRLMKRKSSKRSPPKKTWTVFIRRMSAECFSET